MSNLLPPFFTDIWVTESWEKYLEIIENPDYQKANSYYYSGQVRIEMNDRGHDCGSDRATILFAVQLFGILNHIPFKGLTLSSYRKPGKQEAQPDLSYYIGESAQTVPYGTSIVDLDLYPSPELVIEVAKSSLRDDIGEKRLLYEYLEVKEYWVVDVNNAKLIAFAIADGGSKRISESEVLPGLAMSVLEEALQRTRQTDQSQVGAWLLSLFSGSVSR